MENTEKQTWDKLRALHRAELKSTKPGEQLHTFRQFLNQLKDCYINEYILIFDTPADEFKLLKRR